MGNVDGDGIGEVNVMKMWMVKVDEQCVDQCPSTFSSTFPLFNVFNADFTP